MRGVAWRCSACVARRGAALLLETGFEPDCALKLPSAIMGERTCHTSLARALPKPTRWSYGPFSGSFGDESEEILRQGQDTFIPFLSSLGRQLFFFFGVKMYAPFSFLKKRKTMTPSPFQLLNGVACLIAPASAPFPSNFSVCLSSGIEELESLRYHPVVWSDIRRLWRTT